MLLSFTSDVSAGAALTLVMPVGLLFIVLAWAWRHRERVR
jgi:hypothetical protein